MSGATDMRTITPSRPATRGFTLVEILVGLVLGTLAMIIMYQVFAVFENQRRTTVSGTDAQSSGHISMYMIERDVRLGGLGLNYIRPGDYNYESRPLCSGGIRTYSSTAGGLDWADKTVGNAVRPTVPVRVADGTAASTPPFSDSFTVYYLPSPMSASPPMVKSPITTLTGGIKVTNAPWITANPGSPVNAIFQKDQTILIGQRPEGATGPFKHCVRLKISNITMDTPTNGAKSYVILWTDPGTNYEFNPPSSLYSSFLPVGGYDNDKTYVMPAGGGLVMQTYAVNGSNQLTLNGTAVAEGVISMQVQYGIGNASVTGKPCSGDGSLNDASSDPRCQQVVGWTDAVTNGYDSIDWSALSDMSTPAAHSTTLTNIRRIKAVRLAIVTRSANLERDVLYGDQGSTAAIQSKGAVGAVACGASGDIVGAGGAYRICAWRGPTTGANAVPLIDPSLASDEATCAGSLGTSCWDHYRYRVYETIVPLRNIIWGTATN